MQKSSSLTGAPLKVTPMFEQYLRIKAEHPDALLFFRMGDFYELFFDDAVTTARELQIALTSRNKDAESSVPMCGVPWHAVDNYLVQLIDKGYHVAICDQIEDPKSAKGIVQRAVTRIITPGTVLEDANLNTKSHNYLGAMYWDTEENRGGFTWADVSTGEWSGMQTAKQAELWQWIQKLAPRELLLPEEYEIPTNLIHDGISLVRQPLRTHFQYKRAAENILEAQGVQELEALGLAQKKELVCACGALLAYLRQTQKCDAAHLAPFHPLNLGKHLIIDEITERNLEIFTRLDGGRGKGTLRYVLDDTVTPMGGRLLEERLRHPWRELAPIKESQEAVAFLAEAETFRQRLRETLKTVYDLERLSTRISLNRATPKDFVALRNSLTALPTVYDALVYTSPGTYATDEETQGGNLPPVIYKVKKNWDSLEEYTHLLESALQDSPPPTITEGGLFKAGYHQELDALLDLVEHGEQKLQELLEEEQQKHNLPKLKMGYNRVFGYYYELSRTGSPSVPDHFIRRQTLANAERFTTVALKELEEGLLSAADRRKSLEYTLFQELNRKCVAEWKRRAAAGRPVTRG